MNLAVIPMSKDSYNQETNSLDITLFIGYIKKNGEIQLLPPKNIPTDEPFTLLPIGLLENFVPESLDIDTPTILSESSLNNLTIGNAFDENLLQTFSFKHLSQQVKGYMIELPESTFYLSVLKINYNLDNQDFDYKVFNVVQFEEGELKQTLIYNGDNLELDEDANLDMKELHDIGLSLQFLSFNDTFNNQLESLINMLLLSKDFGQIS